MCQEGDVIIATNRNWINDTFRLRANLRIGFVSHVKCRVKLRGRTLQSRSVYLMTLKSALRVKWLEIYPIPLIWSNKSYLTAGAHATFTEWRMHVPNFWTASKKINSEYPRKWDAPKRKVWSPTSRFDRSVSGYWQLWDFAPDQFYAPQPLGWPHRSQPNRHVDTFVAFVTLQMFANRVARYRKIFDKLTSGENCRSPEKWNKFHFWNKFEEARCTFAYLEIGNHIPSASLSSAERDQRAELIEWDSTREISNFVLINWWISSAALIRSDLSI